MDSVYPAGPVHVPEAFTRPTSTYRSRAWLAMGGLMLFIAVYVALAGWFTWTAWHLLFEVGFDGHAGFWTIVVGASAAFLAVFMLKALIFIKQGDAPEDVEVTPQEQPRLFAFLHRLADEAGAPRPRRVYLSGRVNAAVFYDLSIVNLLFPSRKNLEIGLALVNILTLGELKAVLAHEFGHFAQGSMAVGRWVYIGQQIAHHIVAKRDALDRVLQVLSRIDLRIAWIGWLLSLAVWSIRSTMELLFRGVLLAQRALSREMEFQADLVAVSLTGSDALVHALHRVHAADEAWARALAFAGAEAGQGRRVVDLFAVQKRVIGQLARVLDDPQLGNVPPLPSEKPEAHRVFKAGLAQPPKMWLTHPPSSDREENCKRIYIPAAIDERSAWELFDNIPALKEQMSAHLIRVEQAQPAAVEDSLQRLDEQWDRAYLDRAYRGAFLGRSIALHAREAQELYGAAPQPGQILAELQSLYPPSLATDLEQLRNLQEEQATLRALQAGTLTAPGGIIRHRGAELERKDLPKAIGELAGEIAAVEQRIQDHDRRCRSVHLAGAASIAAGWPEYLRGLSAVLHYAEHTEANLIDARGYFGNVAAIVTADGRVSSSELDRLVTAADALYSALREISEQRTQVVLDSTLAVRLGAECWESCVQPLQLLEPTRTNISEWLKVFDSWVEAYANVLSHLRLSALEQLLVAESQIARHMRDGSPVSQAVEPSQTPKQYTLRMPGTERPRQTRLNWWDRFQVGDGILPSVTRFAVAAAIVGAVLTVGVTVGQSVVAVYNGLQRPVKVSILGVEAQVDPVSSAQIRVPEALSYSVQATTLDGALIESLEFKVDARSPTYVYNVASAAPLVEWIAVYGQGATSPERTLGAPQWMATNADYIFEEPPEKISGRHGGTREVLSAAGAGFPDQLLGLLPSQDQQTAMITAHARWDASDSRYLMYWLGYAAQRDGFAAVVSHRLRQNPNDIATLRVEQDIGTQTERRAICERHRALAQTAPQNPDLQYIAARCIEDAAERDRTFVQLHEKWPENGWLSLAVGYVMAGSGRWDDAIARFQHARRAAPPANDFLALELARLQRVTGNDSLDTMSDLAKDAVPVLNLVTLESGENVPEGPWRAYHELAEGRLDSALQMSGESPEHKRVTWLAAASDGASRALVRKALALPTGDGIDAHTVWIALALATREKGDTRPFIELARKLDGVSAEILLPFIDAARSGGKPVMLEKLLSGARPAVRGQAYATALILRGDSTPPQWRRQARRLLFSYERPFFVDAREAPQAPRRDLDPGVQKDDGVIRTPPRLLGVF